MERRKRGCGDSKLLFSPIHLCSWNTSEIPLKKNDPGKFGSANGRKQFTFARGFSIHRAACSFVNKSPSSSSEIFTTKFDLENNL